MKAEKTVEVTVNYVGKNKGGLLGYYIRPIPTYNGTEWVPTGKKELIFGYVDRYGYMTHMCYGSSYVDWEDMLERVHTSHGDKLYLDAGGNGRPLWVSYTELKRAMEELNIVELSKELVGTQD